MKTYVNIILKGRPAEEIKALKDEAKTLIAQRLGNIREDDVEILIWDEPDPKGHSIDVNGNCNKGCC